MDNNGNVAIQTELGNDISYSNAFEAGETEGTVPYRKVKRVKWGKKEMKTKTKGFALLILLMTMTLLPLTVQARSWTTYPPPSDDEMKQAVSDEMVEDHPELEGLLNYTTWDVELSDYINGSRFKLRATWVDESGTYELIWLGLVSWTRFSQEIYVTEFYYSYEVDLTVAKVGPGTTNSTPGVYHVDGGSSYSFSAIVAISEYPDDYFYNFLKWTINDGNSITEKYSEVISGTAYVDLTITAIFETRFMSYCTIIYEDGLSSGYMWRDDHVLLNIRPLGPSDITVLISSGYGTYLRTFRTGTRSFNIYFAAQRFLGDYTVTVLGTNLDTDETYGPVFKLTGREGILE